MDLISATASANLSSASNTGGRTAGLPSLSTLAVVDAFFLARVVEMKTTEVGRFVAAAPPSSALDAVNTNGNAESSQRTGRCEITSIGEISPAITTSLHGHMGGSLAQQFDEPVAENRSSRQPMRRAQRRKFSKVIRRATTMMLTGMSGTRDHPVLTARDWTTVTAHQNM